MGSTYPANPIKRRQRATKAEVEARRDALCEIISAMQPMTVRQVFYQLVARGVIDALPPRILREMVRISIEWHVSAAQTLALREAEASERELLRMWRAGSTS